MSGAAMPPELARLGELPGPSMMNSADSGSRYSATIIPRTQVELAFKVGGYVEALQQVVHLLGLLRQQQECTEL